MVFARVSAGVILLAATTGCVSLHYPAPANDPLTGAIEVTEVPDNQTLVLRDGRRVLLDVVVEDLKEVIETSDNLVELAACRPLSEWVIQADVFVKKPSAGICGTPYAALISIPLFADRIVPYERIPLRLMALQ